MGEAISVQEEYNKLKEQYDLPDFTELDNNFEISSLGQGSFLLMDISKKMSEKIEHYRDLIYDIIQPDSNSACLYECSYLSDEEKKRYYGIFKKMMFIQRANNISQIEYNPDVAAVAIMQTFNLWNEVKEDIKTLLIKVKDTWNKDINEDQKIFYMG